MRSIRTLVALLALVLGGAACENSVIMPDEVVGLWSDSIAAGTETHPGTVANWLHLQGNGEFVWDQFTFDERTHGRNVPTHRTTMYGNYRLRPGVLEIRTVKLETSGADLPLIVEHVENPTWSGELYAARFEADDLEITYTSGPLDMPAGTRLTFQRQRLIW